MASIVATVGRISTSDAAAVRICRGARITSVDSIGIASVASEATIKAARVTVQSQSSHAVVLAISSGIGSCSEERETDTQQD